MKLISRLAVFTCLCLAFATAQADIVATGEFHTATTPAAGQMATAQRSRLVEQLVASGVEAGLARQRVESMTVAQVAELDGKMAGLPAGAGVSTTNLLLIILILLILL